MAAPVKLSGDPEGDTPELIAWGLTEWIRQVESIPDRVGLLGAFQASLLVARESSKEVITGESPFATGTHRRLAYKLTRLVAEMEGRDLGQRNQGDRAWILQTFGECLEAVLGKRQAPLPTD